MYLGGERAHRARYRLSLAVLVFALFLSSCLAKGDDAWRQTGGPAGAWINALVMDPTRPHILYAGTDSGLYQSSDGGDSWRGVAIEALDDRKIQALAINPHDPDRVYAGTSGGRILRSFDAGGQWSVSPRSLGKIIWSLLVHPAPPEALYAGSDTVYRSEDQGDSWIAFDLPVVVARVSALAAPPDAPETLYVGTDKGFFATEDGGDSWRRPEAGFPNEASVEALLAIPSTRSASGPLLCAATDQGIYCSADKGQSWRQAAQAAGQMAARCLAYAGGSPAILYAGLPGQGIAKSDDEGQTWRQIGPGLDGSMISALVVHPEQPKVIYAGAATALYRSRDGCLSWEPLQKGMVGTDVRALVGLPGQEGHLVASTPWGIYLTDDGGQSWRVSRFPTEIAPLSLVAVSPRVLYAGAWGGQIYRSADGGATWQLVQDNLTDAPITAMTVYTHKNGNLLFAGTDGHGVFRSTDDGATWQPANLGLPDRHVLALALDLWRDRLYAGTQAGVFWQDIQSLLEEKPSPWQPVPGLPPEEIRGIAIHAKSSTLYVALAAELYASNDGGDSWVSVGQETLRQYNAEIQCLALPSEQKHARALYLGTDRGILVSHDSGHTWTWDARNLWTNALVVEGNRRRVIYAGTSGSGVWRGTDGASLQSLWIPLGIGLVAALSAASTVLVRTLSKPKEYGKVQALEENWEEWDRAIQEQLMRHGRATFEALTAIPADLRLAALECYREVHPEEELERVPSPPELRAVEHRRVEAFLRNWQEAQNSLNDPAVFRAAVSRLTNQICNFLGFTRLASRTYKHLHGFVVEGLALRLRIPSRFPIIFVRKADPGPDDILDMHNLMDVLHMTGYFALAIVFGEHFLGPSPAAKLKALAKASARDLVILDFDDLFHTIIARHRERHLTQLLLQQVDLSVVSPYVIHGPVPENMFFGREYEIKTITRTIQNQSFAVVGGRKIGKTSVLTKIARLLRDTPGYLPLYLDCQAIQDEEAFGEALCTRWQINLPKPWEADSFAQALQAVRAGKAEVLPVVLLDEVDMLLAYDVSRQEKLFRVFRALSQENRCRFVFCGERILNARLQDAESPLFNFGEVLRLGFLTPEAIRQIVLEPMQELGVLVEDPDALVERIGEMSSGHPNLVQYICQQLLVHISGKEPLCISLDALESVIRSRYFAEYALATIWGSADPLEKIITLLMIEHPLVTGEELLARLGEIGLRVGRATVQKALDHLVLCSVLDSEKQYYAFAAHAFPDIVGTSQNVPVLLESLCQQMAAAPDGPGAEDA